MSKKLNELHLQTQIKKIYAEIQQIKAETMYIKSSEYRAKLKAEIDKTKAETYKISRETSLYPVIILTGFIAPLITLAITILQKFL